MKGDGDVLSRTVCWPAAALHGASSHGGREGRLRHHGRHVGNGLLDQHYFPAACRGRPVVSASACALRGKVSTAASRHANTRTHCNFFAALNIPLHMATRLSSRIHTVLGAAMWWTSSQHMPLPSTVLLHAIRNLRFDMTLLIPTANACCCCCCCCFVAWV
jgi:hypothetical protein